jgi:excisionase family DNA binding protein
MSSNLTVNRICECCGNIFQAKTTVTRYCSKLCNKRHSKQKTRAEKIAPVEQLIEKMVNHHQHDLSSREFLSVKLAAKLLGVSERIVYAMVNSGRIRSANLAKRKTVIYRQDIDNLFKLPEIVPGPEKEANIDDCYHMAEAQAKFSISEKALYELIKRNNIKKFQSGWYTYVHKKALDQIFNPIID